MSATKVFLLTNNMIDTMIKKYHKWKIGQINVQSCSDDVRLHLILQECKRANLDIICLQEVRRLNTGCLKHLGYSFYWSGLQRIRRHGVGIAIRNDCKITINGIINSGARLMAADLTVKGCKLRVISCYAPTLKTALSTKLSFYRDLKQLTKTEKNWKVLIQGDFNAEPQFCRHNSCFDGRKPLVDGTSQDNENAMLFLKYCQQNELSILNTWYEHPIHHRVTWHHPNGNVQKVYDYSLSKSWLRQYINDVRVRNSYFSSDHRLLVTTLNTPANKAARYFKRKFNPPKPDLQNMLQNNTIKENVCKAVNDFMMDNNYPDSLNELHGHLIQGLSEGRNLIPTATKKQHKPHWDQDTELQELQEERIKVREQNNLTPAIKNKLKQVTKKIRKKVKQIQNSILKKQAENINKAQQYRKITKLWKDAKSHNTVLQSKPPPIQCVGLQPHFKNHFNPDQSILTMPEEVNNPPEYIQLLKNNSLQIANFPPTTEEISNAINQLNKGKSSLDIEAEILKVVSPNPVVMEWLKKYYTEIWTRKEIPNQWGITRITPIWKKKGSSMDPTKYRGISIGSVLCKVGMNIALKRLSTFYEDQLKRTQFGFRSGVSCNDGIYMVKQLQDIADMSERRLYVCFIDLTAAFDHVNREMLFKTIRNRLPQDMECSPLDIIERLYQSTTSYLQNEDPTLNSFPTTSGVRQGGMEGPPLYNLFSDYAIRVHENRKENAGVSGLSIPYEIPNEATNRAQRHNAAAAGVCEDADCGYADDGVLFCWSLNELKTSVKIIRETFSEFGLNVNTDKTETMIFNWHTSTHGSYPNSLITLNGKIIKNVTAFKYLGVWMNHNNLHIGDEELRHRINLAHNAFSENRKLLTNMKIKLNTRIMFLDSLVKTRLTYCCHAWKPSKVEINKIDSTYRYFLRCMIWNGHLRINPPSRTSGSSSDGSSISSDEDHLDSEDYDWAYVVNNEDLYQITKTKSIRHFYEQQQIKWIAHIIRRENNNICKIMTFHKTKRTKRGRKQLSILERCIQNSGLGKSEFLKTSFLKKNIFPS